MHNGLKFQKYIKNQYRKYWIIATTSQYRRKIEVIKD